MTQPTQQPMQPATSPQTPQAADNQPPEHSPEAVAEAATTVGTAETTAEMSVESARTEVCDEATPTEDAGDREAVGLADAAASTQAQAVEYTFERCTVHLRVQFMPARTLADRDGEDRRMWIGVRENEGDLLLREVRLMELGPWPAVVEEMLAQLRAEMPDRARSAQARQASSSNTFSRGGIGGGTAGTGAEARIRPTTQPLPTGSTTPPIPSALSTSPVRFGSPTKKRGSSAGLAPSVSPESDDSPWIQSTLF